MAEETIFTKIIKGEVPCHKVYEDDRVLAFLDIHPVQPGHVLVISKEPANFVWDLPDADYDALMRACKKIARQLKSTLGVPYVGEQIVGVDVPHAHVHLIPFSSTTEFRNIPDMDAEPDYDVLARMADKLKLQG